MHLFAVASKGKGTCQQSLFYGLDYHSHLTQEQAGVAVQNNQLNVITHPIANSQFKTVFLPEYHRMSGHLGIGVLSPVDVQPLTPTPINERIGTFTIATLGHVENFEAMEEKLRRLRPDPWDRDNEGREFRSITSLIGQLISREPTIIDGVKRVFDEIDGSISLLILKTDGIYAARAKYGQSPIAIGRKEDAWALAVETCAFSNLNYRFERQMSPGEIIHLTPDGYETLYAGSGIERLCCFLSVYTGYPPSAYHGMSAEMYRNLAGAELARADFKAGLRVDAAFGIADSGTPYAVGYAKELRALVRREVNQFILTHPNLTAEELAIKVDDILDCATDFGRGFSKYNPGWTRSFTQKIKELQEMVASMKQLLVEDIFEGLHAIVGNEDSIVRGTQLTQLLERAKRIIEQLWHKKAPDIHIRVGYPPYAFHCPYMHSIRSVKELLVPRVINSLEGKEVGPDIVRTYLITGSERYNKLQEAVAKHIGAKSVRYLTLAQLHAILGDNICDYCSSGRLVGAPLTPDYLFAPQAA